MAKEPSRLRLSERRKLRDTPTMTGRTSISRGVLCTDLVRAFSISAKTPRVFLGIPSLTQKPARVNSSSQSRMGLATLNAAAFLLCGNGYIVHSDELLRRFLELEATLLQIRAW